MLRALVTSAVFSVSAAAICTRARIHACSDYLKQAAEKGASRWSDTKDAGQNLYQRR